MRRSFSRPSAAIVLWLVAACTDVATGPLPVPDAGGADTTLPTADVQDNSPPGPVSVALTPEAPTTLDEIAVTLVEAAFDPDDGPEPLTYQVRWTRDGESTPHTAMTIPPAVTRRGEVWRVEVAAFDGAANGPWATAEVTIGNSPPAIEKVTLTPATPGEDDVLVCAAVGAVDPDDDAVSISYSWFVDNAPIPGATTAALQPPLTAGASYQCGARPFDGELEGEAVGSNLAVVPLIAATEAIISLQPKSLDLGTVFPFQMTQADLTISNIGTGPLEILDYELTGDPVFTFGLELPATVAAGTSLVAKVSFATEYPGLHKGSLELATNAKNAVAAKVPLLGLGASPCLQVTPNALEFGGVYPPTSIKKQVQLTSCGVLPLVLESIGKAAGGSASFTVDTAPLPTALPVTLQPGESTFVNVFFEPTGPSPTDADGLPIPETAKLSILTNQPSPLVEVPASGFAVASGCPVPVIEVYEGTKTVPNSTIHLSAAKSFGAFGLPSLMTWAVTSTPPGAAVATIQPDVASAEVTFDVSVPGEYVFSLSAFDETSASGGPCGDGGDPCTQVIPGCSVASATVDVKDAVPLRVELTWDTPGDTNASDIGPGKGADLDLHVHDGRGEGPDYDGDGAPDSWFDLLSDCYWFDPSPPWGEDGEDDDPLLAQEDADGWGPERLDYLRPYPGGAFTVGAHVYSAFDYGPSIATLKIYLYEELAWEITDVVLDHGDLWEAATVLWPSGEILPAVAPAGGAKITASYPNPFYE